MNGWLCYDWFDTVVSDWLVCITCSKQCVLIGYGISLGTDTVVELGYT